jgi:hypothetical protein
VSHRSEISTSEAQSESDSSSPAQSEHSSDSQHKCVSSVELDIGFLGDDCSRGTCVYRSVSTPFLILCRIKSWISFSIAATTSSGDFDASTLMISYLL